ncbi:MAG: hypothetical protein KDJ52_13230 [Anaerolineae bacterium]|nr:hypothetical protein [Anaerolineae bacterium]
MKNCWSNFDASSDMLNTWKRWVGVPAWFIPALGGVWWLWQFKKERQPA